jgi:hypothetical protein
VINITGDPNSASEQLLIDNVQVYPLVAPTVTTQPHSLTNSTGTTATFSVWAVGTAPLSYQWYFNTNTPLTAGTNSVLTLNNVQGSDGGTYSVIVTNAGGAVTSSVAMLTVLPNLTVNGDFEAPTTTGFTRFAAGSTALTGWTVDAAPSDGVQLGTAGEFGAVNGSQNVQLTGGQNYSVGGGISQTIATTPGRTYTVSIDVAARSAAPVMGNFNFGGSNHVLTATSLSTFTTLTWQVSATSSNTVINITGDPNSASEQLIIGNVVVAELDLFTQLPNGN